MIQAPAFPAGSNPSTSEIADWCESTALMTRKVFKRGDLKSALSREDVGNPDLIEEQTWAALSEREVLFGASWQLTLEGSQLYIKENATSDETLLQTYLCILALGDIDPEDRALFEEIVRYIISLKVGDSAIRIGHPARGNAPKSFRERVEDYATQSNLTTLEQFQPPLPNDKDLGMDVVAWLPTPDRRGGYMHFLIQCATGKNMESKSADIDLNVINSHIKWAVDPVRIFSVPNVLALPEANWIRFTQRAGWILDRPRLMHFASGANIPDSLRDEVSARIDALSP